MDGEQLLHQLARHPGELERHICELSLHQFIQAFWRQMGENEPFQDNWHIHEICEHLEAVSNGEIRRLIINIPPRSMKSLSVTAWQAWTWAQQSDPDRPLKGPGVRFLTASYSPEMVRRDNNKARRVIQSRKYRTYWGERFLMMPDENRTTRYDTTAGGFRFGASTRGGVTGEGGDIILVDDPIDPRKAAVSDSERQHVIEWWRGVLSSRSNNPKTSARVLIMQRVHDQDPTGYVLQNEKGWTHLCIPARYEPDHPHPFARDPRTKRGELMWPERINEEFLLELEETMGSYHAAGQLQQRPSPRKGGMFERDWCELVPEPPAKAVRCRGWDFAGTKGKKSAYTVGMLMSRTGKRYCVEHVERFRGSPHEVKKRLIELSYEEHEKWGDSYTVDFPQDPGSAGKFQAQDFAAELAGMNVRFSPETGNKDDRARPFSAQCEAGNVDIVDATWTRNLLDEMVLFPNSDYKDQVDAASRAFARLSRRKPKRHYGPILITADEE